MKSFENLIDATTRATLQKNRQIQQVISQIVPASSRSHILFCRIEGGRLRVTVDSAAWVTKLRFNETRLIRALQASRMDVHTMSIHVSPAEVPKPRSTVRIPNRPSERSAAAVAALADALSETPESNVQDAAQQGITRNLIQGSASAAQREDKKVNSGDRLRQELLKLAATLRSR